MASTHSLLRPVVVVTGASRGLGLAVTSALLKQLNATVVAVSRTRTPELTQLSDAHADTLKLVECSVADEPAFAKAIADVEKTHGGIDGLVLNAGTLHPLGRIDAPSSTLDAWRSHFDVNFFSLVTALKAALPALRASRFGGKVVFVSSGAAAGGVPGWGPYNASKAAMNSLCRTLAQEEPDIVCVAVRPGKVDTEMQATLREQGGAHMRAADHESFVREHAEGRLVRPEDAGHVIAALALGAHSGLSGAFVSWDSAECSEFRRAQ